MEDGWKMEMCRSIVNSLQRWADICSTAAHWRGLKYCTAYTTLSGSFQMQSYTFVTFFSQTGDKYIYK